MKALLKLPAAGWLLDAGGGTGRVSAALQASVDGVVIADLSPGMVKQAMLKHSLQSILCPVERLPFEDETFSRVVMVDALHHVISQQKTAAELWRVLQPGGRILIEEPDVRTVIVKLVAVAEKLALMRSHFLGPQAIANLFRFPGATVRIEIESYNAFILIDKAA